MEGSTSLQQVLSVKRRGETAYIREAPSDIYGVRWSGVGLVGVKSSLVKS